MWHSGDKYGPQSQRSGVQIQVSAKLKKTGGFRFRDRVRAGGECVIVYIEKHLPPSPPPKKVENHLEKSS